MDVFSVSPPLSIHDPRNPFYRPRLLSISFPDLPPFATPDIPRWLKFFQASPDGKLWFPQQGYIQSPYFATGNPETEEMTTLYAPGMLGLRAEFDQGGIAGPMNKCIYQLVKQNTSITAVVGNVMYWVSKGSTYVVTTTATNTGNLAGIARIAATAAATYIWICKKGDREVLFVDSPTSAPDATGKPVVGVTATAGKADSLALTTAPVPWPPIGATLGAQDGTSKRASVRINIIDHY
jgi:hypothetical protein